MVFYKIEAVSEEVEEKFELSSRCVQRKFAEELAEKDGNKLNNKICDSDRQIVIFTESD
jgi:hypothetical protein